MLPETELQGISPIFGLYLLTLFMAALLKLFYTLEISGRFDELFLIFLPMYCSRIISLLFRRASFLRSELRLLTGRLQLVGYSNWLVQPEASFRPERQAK